MGTKKARADPWLGWKLYSLGLDLLLFLQNEQSTHANSGAQKQADGHERKGLGAGFGQFQNRRIYNAQHNFKLVFTFLFGNKIALPDMTGHQRRTV